MTYSSFDEDDAKKFRKNLKKTKAKLNKIKDFTLFEKRVFMLKEKHINFKLAKKKNWKKLEQMYKIVYDHIR